MRIGTIIEKAKGKPLDILAFRGLQEARLLLLRQTDGWTRVERRARSWWDAARVSAFIAARSAPTVLAPDAVTALCKAAADGDLDRSSLVEFGDSAVERRFSVFGVPVPATGMWPWHEDWRLGYRWPQQPYHEYDFYAARQVPYDVKFPWELSRLFFIPRVLQAASLTRAQSSRFLSFVGDVLVNWEQENPLARSIAWYSMEASMRALTLVTTLDMLRLLGVTSRDLLAVLLRLLSIHGEFVWRNREYSELRGNHYSANIVALAATGSALEHWYPNASRWATFAREAVPGEIVRQFLPDGVHFEKATGYQRLVIELFLFAALTFERRGTPLPREAMERIRAACRYAAECVRPDGLTPHVGDDDDGRTFHFDSVPARDIRPMLSTARVLWEAPEFDRANTGLVTCPVWLLGSRAVAQLTQSGHTGAPTHRCRHFKPGGVVVARERNHFFWMDIGEVGLCGHGGHGHNDLLSFEFVFDGYPLFVDPGGYVYTANPEMRNLFRSSLYHNGLVVDNEEIAPMQGMWQIRDSAQPTRVRVDSDASTVRIYAGHSGYTRLPDPVEHDREIRIHWGSDHLEVFDRLRCLGVHSTVRSLHLSSGTAAYIDGSGAVLTGRGAAWRLTWNSAARVVLEEGWVSPSYAVRHPALILRLSEQIESDAQLWFRLRPLEHK